MSENTAKLNKLRKEIESCAESEAAAIIEAAQKTADEAIASAEKQVRRTYKDNTRQTVENFRAEERRRISETRFSEGKRVLMHRSALVDEFFSRVEAELRAETEKDSYRDYISRSVAEARKTFSLENAQVYCREQDIALAGGFVTENGVQVLVSENISIGGIIVKIPEKGIIMDLSLDAALENERESFSASEEMQL